MTTQKSSFGIALLFLILQNFPCNGQIQWTWKNPLPQGNFLKDVHFIDSTNGIAVGERGTIIRTTDGGQSWTISHNTAIVDYASVDYSSANTGIIVGEDGVILHTIDGGSSWIDRHTTNVKTLNGVAFSDLSNVVAVGRYIIGKNGVILRSTDGGSTWSLVNREVTYPLNDVDFLDDHRGIAVGDGGIVLSTSDGGISWTALKTNAGMNDWNAVCCIGLNTIIVVGDSAAILRSTDGGQSWERQSPYPESPWQHDESFTDVDFVNSMYGFAVSDDGCAVHTSNGGETWEFSGKVVEYPLHGLSALSPDRAICIGDHGTIWETIAGAQSYTRISSGVTESLNRICFVSDSSCFAVGGAGTVLHTSNLGNTWEERSTPITYRTWYGIAFIDEYTGVVVGSNDATARTTDAGRTWEMISSGADHGLYDVAFRGNNGFAVGYGGVIRRSANGGRSWVRSTNSVSRDLNRVQFLDDRTAIAIGASGTILRTTNTGISWYQIPSGVSQNLRGLVFLNRTEGLIVGDNGTILRTTDGGESWAKEEKEDVRYNHLIAVSFKDDNAGMILGRDGLVLTTTNGGRDWNKSTPWNQGLYFADGILFRSDSAVAVGAYGRILMTAVPKLTGIQSVQHGQRLVHLDQNYPNPVTTNTIIRFALSKLGHVRLSIYDALGREVAVLVDEVKEAGEQSVPVNVARLRAGIYFTVLKTGSVVETKKMVVVESVR